LNLRFRVYDSCGDYTDFDQKEIISYFQYFYIDDNASKIVIGQCTQDSSRTEDIVIAKDYDSCNDFVDTGSLIVYEQYQEIYTDNAANEIIIAGCTIDYSKSHTIEEDYVTCGIRHLFDENYSIAQKRLYYTKDSQEIVVQDCQDSNILYSHYTTSQGCNSVVIDDQVTIFERVYIVVEGYQQYITDCEPLEGNAAIEEENCTTEEFTHDLTSNQSFRNKNYFYLDGSDKIYILECVQSDETFPHLEDTSVCFYEDDDVLKQTVLSAKTYIVVDGYNEYITDCNQVEPPIAYTQIGDEWQTESVTTTSITVSNSGDDIYLGSEQGEEVRNDSYGKTSGYWSDLINKFDIEDYSTDRQCDSWSSPSYNGSAIDMLYSDPNDVTLNNYVEERSGESQCRDYCGLFYSSSCHSFQRVCNTSLNTLYYQRCTSHTCPIAKINKKPIYRRHDQSQYTDITTTLEVKYVCNDNDSLDGVQTYY